MHVFTHVLIYTMPASVRDAALEARIQITATCQWHHLIGPIPWGHSGPLCHALSLSGVVVDIDAQATPGEWACGGSQ